MNLDSLCRKLNVNNTRQNYHGALLDATLLSKVYLKLTTGKQETFNLKENKYVKLNVNENIAKYKKSFLLPRDHLMSLSNYEKQEHEKFLEKMENSMWKKIQ